MGKYKNIIIGAIAVIVISIFGWLVFSTDTQEDGGVQTQVVQKEETFDTVPPFTLKDYNGNEVTQGDFDGKVLVLNSWATWCPFCVDELPAFEKLQATFPEEIIVIAIDRSESLTQVKSYSDDLGLSDKILFLLDPADSFYRSIGGFSMPETLFVDSDGNIRVHKRGPMTFEEMKDKIESIL